MTSQAEPQSASYDPSVAMEFFQFNGKVREFRKEERIFAENERGLPILFMPNRMYLLLQGEVSVLVGDSPVATVREGEVFGEMAAINQTRRSATAVAKTPCRVISLDDEQFHRALSDKPEFALMLMSVMVGRLRETLARRGGGPIPAGAGPRDARLMDKTLLAVVEKEIGPEARFRFEAGRTLMQEGQLGVALYVVLEGEVDVRIGDTPVERAGAGSLIGEMGLVDRTPRFGTAVARTACTLLAVSRLAFLKLVRKNPQFGVAVLGMVSERARSMTERCNAEASTLGART